jgi:HemY protein
MRRVFLFLIIAAAFIAGAWLLAQVPGHVNATVGPFAFETSAPVAILAIILLVLAVIILLRIITGIMRLPRSGAGWRRRQRRKAGEAAVTRVLVALAAGDQNLARRQARRARALLGNSPQVLLLLAEACRLAGREDEANEAFRTLARQKDARFLGLRGLLRQAIDRRDWTEALAIANQAEAARPGTAWLRQQRAELALQTGNWAEALDLVKNDARRTVYYTAAADAEPDPTRALAYAKQAWKEDPTFPPAVLAYARRLRVDGNERRARTIVTEAWRRAPHPDLAEFMLAPEPDKEPRYQAAKLLTQRNEINPESRLLLARAALDAGLIADARSQVEAARAEGLNQRRLYLLLAEIEEVERGNTEDGRLAQRDALRQAASADPDPHWECASCRTDHVAWQPKCTSCGGVATLQWVSDVGTRSVPAVINMTE